MWIFRGGGDFSINSPTSGAWYPPWNWQHAPETWKWPIFKGHVKLPECAHYTPTKYQNWPSKWKPEEGPPLFPIFHHFGCIQYPLYRAMFNIWGALGVKVAGHFLGAIHSTPPPPDTSPRSIGLVPAHRTEAPEDSGEGLARAVAFRHFGRRSEIANQVMVSVILGLGPGGLDSDWIPLWKGLLLSSIPWIPDHRAPNQQFTII